MSKSTHNKASMVLVHSLAWLVLIILPQLIINRYWGNQNFISWGFYLDAAIYGIIFYINYLWLVPSYYLNNKKVIYFASSLVTIILLYFVSEAISDAYLRDPERDKKIAEALAKLRQKDYIVKPPMRQMKVYFFALTSIIISGLSLGLKVNQKHSETEKKQKELEQEKLNSELAFLKNQVSPHFFFNTLNNIYALIGINANDAQESVLKLSKMMRYLLYESENGETELKEEVNFLKNYINLMCLRVSSKVKVDVDLPNENLHQKIPALLFIPFIENAFKHGISYREKSFIDLSMHVEEGQLTFKCVNSIVNNPEVKNDKAHSGIGLENVKKRLQLLFPEKHELRVRRSNEAFTILLNIHLN